MQDGNAWIYGPTGRPIESIPVDSQPTMVMQTVKPARRWRRLALRLLLSLLLPPLLLVGTGTFFWFNPMALGTASLPLLPPQPDAVPWNGTDPINILAMGVDQRVPGEHTHSDTMIVLTLDPKRGHVRLVSIPRDLAVDVPSYGDMSKINEGYYLGGPRYAAFVVQHSLGIPINYYAVLKFSGFRRLIDALGGVDVTVDQNINDPQFPCDVGDCYSSFVLSAGPHHMDGALALRYVRERHVYADSGGDEVRITHQQQVIAAIKGQLFSLHTLLHLPSILDALRATVNSNMPNNMLPVIALMIVQDRNIEHVYLDEKAGVVSQCVGYDLGADLCPNHPAFDTALRTLFQNPGLAGEHASVWVQNGTASHLAVPRVTRLLTACGFSVAGNGPADNNHHAHTAVIVNSAQPPAPYTTRLLRQMFAARLLTRSLPDVHAQVIVLIGNDAPEV